MPTAREEPIEFQRDGAESRAGNLHITDYNEADRRKRAAKAWAICWALALAAAPIIIVHLVAVPGFLLAGPFMAYRYYHIESVPKKLTGQCPSCQEQISIGLESSDTLPMWTYCPSCNTSIHAIEAAGGN